MQDFFANCATVLQKYGFSYLRGAGTPLLCGGGDFGGGRNRSSPVSYTHLTLPTTPYV